MLTKKTIEPVLGGEEDWQKAETVDGERGWGEDGSDAQEPLVTLEVAKTRASSKLKPDLCLKHATSRTAAITPQTNPGGVVSHKPSHHISVPTLSACSSTPSDCTCPFLC